MSALELPLLKVVCGVIRNEQGFYFVALRPPGVPFSGLWEFPGGKIEPQETAYDALVRELKEEIGIHVRAAKPLLQLQHRYPTRSIAISSWMVTEYLGEPHGAEGQETDWVTLEKLATLSFPEASNTLIQYLNSCVI